MRSFKALASGLLLAALIVGGCTQSNPTTPTTATTTCTFAIGQASTSAFGPEGGTGSVGVTAASGCAWTAVSNVSFITISTGASGTSNGTVQFTVGASSATADRAGTLTIGGSTVTITQRAAAAPTPVTLSAPTTSSPTGGQFITTTRPVLVVSNAAASGGSAGTVTYHFEVSDLSTFPNDPVRTFTADGVAQGAGGTTSWTLTRDLGPNVLWYWRARATNGSVTSAFSNVATFSTGTACTYALSTTTVTIGAAGGPSTITVTAPNGCAWTATSNASFMSVTAGATGTGGGTVTFTVAAGSGVRTGTLTIAGQTVTVTQQGANLVVGFRLLDPGRGPGATTDCQIRSTTSTPTQCTLESTSFPTGTNAITNYFWTVSYTYPSEKNLFQTGANPQFNFTEMCGQTLSNDSGYQLELRVTLTVTDSEGNTVTVPSNAGSQPLLTLRAYICGV